jgi:Flp pilus assembly protein TadD
VSDWVSAAASRLAQQKSPQRVLIETAAVPADERPVFGYFASSSETNSGRPPRTLRFVPGSLAARFADADARTFREPANVRRTTAGHRDVLLGDLIRAGVTGAAGFVGDPTGGSIVRPDILFPAYMAGFNLAEAFYMAMPHLSRRTVVIGDPLCAPFRRTILSRSDIEPPEDPVMELSATFARRRLAALRREYAHVSEGALMLSIRANVYGQRGDAATARRLLEAATAFSPNFASAQAQLAVLYDRAEQRQLAIDRYRRALDAQPPYVRGEIVEISNLAGVMEVRQLALNNLAFDLAVYQGAPQEALPFAQKALTYAPDDPDLLDTLGWIEHLLGDDNNAITHLRAAVARMPVNADVWLHAAVVTAAFDLRADAEKYLNIALQLNAALETSEEVAKLRERIKPSAAVPSR